MTRASLARGGADALIQLRVSSGRGAALLGRSSGRGDADLDLDEDLDA
jgi:hypothetical protein